MGGLNDIPKVKISKTYLPLYQTEKRYILVTGGRGSLKSSTIHDFVARLTFGAGHGILMLRYTMTSAEKSIIPEFKLTIERLGLIDKFDIKGSVITNILTGSFIMFAGIKTSSGNQTAALKSIPGLTTIIIEEGEDFIDEKAYDTIDDSLRSVVHQNRIIWIMNPTTREHFIYKRWIEPKNKVINVKGWDVTVSDLDYVEHIHSTYHLADRLGYLNKSFIEKANRHLEYALKSENPNQSHYYYNYIGGWKEKAEGTILDYTVGAFDDKLAYCYGLDFGYSPDPLAVIKVAINERRKRIYLKEIIYATEINNVSEALLNANVDRKDLIVCDTSEPRTRTAIEKTGFNIQNTVKNRIVDDIREIKEYEIIIDPNSPNLKKELDNYIWNDKKASIPVDAYNHLIDGFRYAFNRLKRPSAISKPMVSDNIL